MGTEAVVVDTTQYTQDESLSAERIMNLAYLNHLKNMEHYESADCWCYPTLMFCDPETNRCVYKHYLPH